MRIKYVTRKGKRGYLEYVEVEHEFCCATMQTMWTREDITFGNDAESHKRMPELFIECGHMRHNDIEWYAYAAFFCPFCGKEVGIQEGLT